MCYLGFSVITLTRISSAFFNDVTYVEPAVPALFTVMSSGEHASNHLIYGSHTNSFVLKANETVEIVLNNNDDGVSYDTIAYRVAAFMLTTPETPIPSPRSRVPSHRAL